MESIGIGASMVALQAGGEPLFDKIWFVIIAAVLAQAVVGALGLAGFVAVSRRIQDKELPGQIAELAAGWKDLAAELREMRREVDRHTYKIESLEAWRADQRASNLDDTRGGPRPSGNRSRQ